ncbi:MAG: putative ABC transport system permease protein [Pirellulaceae bacterium]|jgi:putative ABC transport system permease protein
MNLFKIAWRSIQYRGLASGLTMFSMALGVMLVVAVLSISAVVTESFQKNSSLGYNMIVGATKGGKLQLTLNTVFYLSSPVENIPYHYYLEFHDAERRQREMEFSLTKISHDETWNAIGTQQQLEGGLGLPLAAALAASTGMDALQQRHTDKQELERDGRYANFVKLAIPVCLGDFYDRFLVVGTTPEFFNDIILDEEKETKYEFAEGRNFEYYNNEHGFWEAVVGSTVASEKGLKIGAKISPAHGAPDGHTHDRGFTVVGILKPSGTPNDRGVFVNMEGFFLIEDHVKPVNDKASDDDEVVAEEEVVSDSPFDRITPLPIEQREVTAILVRTKDARMAPFLYNSINEGQFAQAALPVRQIYTLFETIVGPIQFVFLLLTAMICIVSGVSILVSIYNSMSDRRQEIAVMRALGAKRDTIMIIILLESLLLSLGGGMIGWVSGHLLNVLASPMIEARTGVALGFFDIATKEWYLVPGLVALAVIVGFIPAISAYRTDVAQSLGK